MKYQVSMYTRVMVWPSNAKMVSDANSEKEMQEMMTQLSEGWEIYKAIPLATQDAAIIVFIIRKKTK